MRTNLFDSPSVETHDGTCGLLLAWSQEQKLDKPTGCITFPFQIVATPFTRPHFSGPSTMRPVAEPLASVSLIFRGSWKGHQWNELVKLATLHPFRFRSRRCTAKVHQSGSVPVIKGLFTNYYFLFFTFPLHIYAFVPPGANLSPNF